MKKIIKFIKFLLISLVVFYVYAVIANILFKLFWNFGLFNPESYAKLQKFWEKGGVFKEFREISLAVSLICLPIFWLISSYKLYKRGFWKTILSPFLKLYLKMTRPKNLEVEHVSIKNLGSKSRSLDEIISDKMKERGENISQQHTTANIRQQVSAKVEENKIQ